MASAPYGTFSELKDGENDSFIQRCHRQSDPNYKGILKSGWVFVVINIILETLLVIFDQMASIQEPQYERIAWELSLAVLIVCIVELIYRGLVKEKLTLSQCLKSLIPCSNSGQKKPYSLEDGVVLAGAKVQMALSSISYGYMLRGKESPIRVSLISLIFILCFVFYKFLKKQYCNRADPLLPVRLDN